MSMTNIPQWQVPPLKRDNFKKPRLGKSHFSKLIKETWKKGLKCVYDHLQSLKRYSKQI